jgi:hypothetical protein
MLPEGASDSARPNAILNPRCAFICDRDSYVGRLDNVQPKY